MAETQGERKRERENMYAVTSRTDCANGSVRYIAKLNPCQTGCHGVYIISLLVRSDSSHEMFAAIAALNVKDELVCWEIDFFACRRGSHEVVLSFIE